MTTQEEVEFYDRLDQHNVLMHACRILTVDDVHALIDSVVFGSSGESMLIKSFLDYQS